MSDEVRVGAHLTARADAVDDVRAVLEGFIAPTREEDGCIQYELHQNTADPCDFTFIEAWRSAGALETHLQSAHIQAGLGKLGGLLAGDADIRQYTLLA